jgi:hypothetical protein
MRNVIARSRSSNMRPRREEFSQLRVWPTSDVEDGGSAGPMAR